jgi:hypothetical protein
MNYLESNIHQKINGKANSLVDYGKENAGRLMKQAKKGYFIGQSRLKLEPDGIHNNRNYDGPGDDYYADMVTAPEIQHRMIEAQKLK